jgi:GNAT superfamily N-acetyltransferase
MHQVLDNVVWEALNGAHKNVSAGGAASRRYAQGFSPIVGFADRSKPDFDTLAQVCSLGESFYTEGWIGTAPEGWSVDLESMMFKMIWEGELPNEDPADGATALGPDPAKRALELATLTNPGPFGIRTLELGDYYGYFDGDQLISMSGERFFAGSLREISGVCTHPNYQGRGLAGKLMTKLIRRQVLRGETPFLHVMSSNTHAQGLYTRMGFREYNESVVRILTYVGSLTR